LRLNFVAWNLKRSKLQVPLREETFAIVVKLGNGFACVRIKPHQKDDDLSEGLQIQNQSNAM